MSEMSAFTGHRMVAMCDILGFKNLLDTTPLDRVVAEHLSFFRKALTFSVTQDEWSSSPPSLAELAKTRRVGVAWFSDTVLLFGREDTPEDRQRVVETAGWLLFTTNLTSLIRCRAGISYGEIHADPSNGIYVGKAIVDAHDLEGQQEWAGGALTDSAAAMLPAGSTKWFDSWLCRYPVPLKGRHREMLAIDWTKGCYEPAKIGWSARAPEPSEQDEKEHAEIVAKWRNTRNFHDAVCTWCVRERGRSTRL